MRSWRGNRVIVDQLVVIGSEAESLPVEELRPGRPMEITEFECSTASKNSHYCYYSNYHYYYHYCSYYHYC